MNQPEILLIPLVIGLVQIVKEAGLPHRFISLFTVGLALAVGYATGVDWIQSIIIGLSAMGIWSGTKNLVGK